MKQLKLEHLFSAQQTEKLEDAVKKAIEENFDEQVNIVSELTGNELTANPEGELK